MASVQILNSTLKNAQYAFRKAGLPSDRSFFVKGLREVFNDNPKICTKNGKFTKDGIFALKRVIEDNGLNQASNWDDLAQAIIARRVAIKPLKEPVQKVYGRIDDVCKVAHPQQIKKVDFPEEFSKEVLKYIGGTELYMRQMASKELATPGGTVDIAKFIRLLPDDNATNYPTKARSCLVQLIDELKQAGKKIEISDKSLLSRIDGAILSGINVIG